MVLEGLSPGHHVQRLGEGVRLYLEGAGQAFNLLGARSGREVDRPQLDALSLDRSFGYLREAERMR